MAKDPASKNITSRRQPKMFIREIKRQHRRDFYADFECENCGYIEKDHPGYDDAYYHNHVVSEMVCPKCGKSALDLGTDYRPLTTKYPEGMQV